MRQKQEIELPNLTRAPGGSLSVSPSDGRCIGCDLSNCCQKEPPYLLAMVDNEHRLAQTICEHPQTKLPIVVVRESHAVVDERTACQRLYLESATLF